MLAGLRAVGIVVAMVSVFSKEIGFKVAHEAPRTFGDAGAMSSQSRKESNPTVSCVGLKMRCNLRVEMQTIASFR